MADSKLSALTELTTPANEDLLYIVDDPSGTPLSKKVTVANLAAVVGSKIWPAFTSIVDGDYAWINQSSATKTVNANGGVYLTNTHSIGDGNQDVMIRKKSAPATPYTITAALLPYNSGGCSFGLVFRESGTGELHTFGYGFSGQALSSSKWTSPTVFSAHYSQLAMVGMHPSTKGLLWLRIADNGTNRICSFSADGYNWHAWHTIGRTDWLTANEVGFYISTANGTDIIGVTFMSWLAA